MVAKRYTVGVVIGLLRVLTTKQRRALHIYDDMVAFYYQSCQPYEFFRIFTDFLCPVR